MLKVLEKDKNNNKNSIEEQPVIALIAGPGGDTFNYSHIAKTEDFLKKAGFNTVVIGNGETPVSEGFVDASLKAYKNNHNLTVLVVAHGYKTAGGGHISWLGEKADTDTYGILHSIAKTRAGKHTDFVLTSSYGQTLLSKAYKKLPRRSCITVLAPDSGIVTGEELVSLSEQVCKNLEKVRANENNAFASNKRKKKLPHYAQTFGYCFAETAKNPKVAIGKKGLIDPSEYGRKMMAKNQSFFEKLFAKIAL